MVDLTTTLKNLIKVSTSRKSHVGERKHFHVRKKWYKKEKDKRKGTRLYC